VAPGDHTGGVVRYRVVVTGRVQGVWYRESCRREATAAGVAGWVRNNYDGTVEAVLEGEQSPVDRVVAWMRTGPRHAVVTGVDVRVESPEGERGFAVR
jgi:acylphosphatase